MKLYDFFKSAILTGIENDPRGKDIVLKNLAQAEKDYETLKPKEKDIFDIENLENPYSDSRILNGKEDVVVKTILAGIDIEVSELLLADSLRQKGVPIDVVLSHHPSGRAYANLYSVMYMQPDILCRFGVPINVAESTMDSRAKEVERKLMPINHTRAVDAARLLNIPFMCLHTPADNMVATFLQNLFNKEKPYTLDDAVDLLIDIPEYKEALKNNAGPKILNGSKKHKAGKIFVDMTGGTEGAKEIFKNFSSSGINTVVAMHFSEEHRKEAENNYVNIIIAGHIASDNLGVNLLLDKVTEKNKITILECSGFKRVQRD